MTCPRCHAENPAGMRFCGHCGAPLDRAADVQPKEPPQTPAGELKRVSMLFCDLVGSTALAERLGAETMHELIRWFIDTALAEVERYEGTTPQFSGDGFLALFGAPITHEDHVRRALLAALGIREAVSGKLSEAPDRGWPNLDL